MDHGAGMRFSAAVTDWIATPDAVVGVSGAAGRSTAFNAAKRGSTAGCGILARGIVAPGY